VQERIFPGDRDATSQREDLREDKRGAETRSGKRQGERVDSHSFHSEAPPIQRRPNAIIPFPGTRPTAILPSPPPPHPNTHTFLVSDK
jgi:hypothetical protein